MSRALRVFISYSHKDDLFREELEKHLALLRRQGLITTWTDRRIAPGEEWEKQIDQEMENADILLLLISSDFIHSDYCFAVEMKRAMARHEAASARVVPIILRLTDWQSAPFGKLQALPKDGKAITKWTDHDEAWLDVAMGIRKIIEEIGSGFNNPHSLNKNLISLGPDIIASGELLGTSGLNWRFALREPFVVGNLGELSRFGERFDDLQESSKYLICQTDSIGRMLAAPPSWRKEKGNIVVDVVVAQQLPRVDARSLQDTDLSKELDGGNGRLSGIEVVPRLVSRFLTTVKGQYRAYPEYGSRIAEFQEKLKPCGDIMESLIRLEILRAAFVLHSDAFSKKQHVFLNFIESVDAVNMVNKISDEGSFNIRINLKLSGIKAPWMGDIQVLSKSEAWIADKIEEGLVESIIKNNAPMTEPPSPTDFSLGVGDIHIAVNEPTGRFVNNDPSMPIVKLGRKTLCGLAMLSTRISGPPSCTTCIALQKMQK